MIELLDIWHSYGNRQVIKGISERFEDGRVYAIIGRNGSGKSTLLRIMAGLIRPTRGVALVNGKDIGSMKPREAIKEVGIVFQNPDYQLFEETVYREVEFALKNLGIENNREQMVGWALRELGLEGLKDRPPLTLSGGEKKRLTIAAVIAWRPRALLLDEPTVGQDQAFKELLMRLIKGHAEKGGPVIISTHDMEFLWKLNPNAVLISDGVVLCRGEFRRLALKECFRSTFEVLPGLAALTRALGLSDPLVDDKEAVEAIMKWR